MQGDTTVNKHKDMDLDGDSRPTMMALDRKHEITGMMVCDII